MDYEIHPTPLHFHRVTHNHWHSRQKLCEGMPPITSRVTRRCRQSKRLHISTLSCFLANASFIIQGATLYLHAPSLQLDWTDVALLWSSTPDYHMELQCLQEVLREEHGMVWRLRTRVCVSWEVMGGINDAQPLGGRQEQKSGGEGTLCLDLMLQTSSS